MSLIKYGMSADNYVEDWGYQEAVREIVQNFRDYGEFKEEVRFVKESNPSIVYSNDYIPESLEFLKVGFSKKHSSDAVGKYGEGLKLGMMVLHRLGLNPMICFPKQDIKVEIVEKSGSVKWDGDELQIFTDDDQKDIEFDLVVSDSKNTITKNYKITLAHKDEDWMYNFDIGSVEDDGTDLQILNSPPSAVIFDYEPVLPNAVCWWKPEIVSKNYSGVTKLTPTIYEDDDLGSCFGIESAFIPKLTYEDFHNNRPSNELAFIEELKGFTILFDNSEHQDEMKDYFLSEEDIIFKSSYGSIVDKEVGSIFVGGIFVTKNDSIKDRAYDLKPEHVDMGRDRNFPSSYDLKWTVGRIYQDYLKEFPESFENHSYDEVVYMDIIPTEVTKDINPIVLGGEIKYQYTKTKQVLNSNLESSLIKDERLKKEVEKIKRGFTKRKTPIEMLEAFKDNYYYSLSYDAKMDLQNIIDRVPF